MDGTGFPGRQCSGRCSSCQSALIRRGLLHIASHRHIPELDAMILMNAKFRGWCHYYKYANNPTSTFQRVIAKMWWFYAHFLARKQKQSCKQLLTRATQTGNLKVVKKSNDQRQTFTIKVGKRES